MMELKTKYDANIVGAHHLSGSDDDCEHDALAAHAWEQTIEQAKANGWSTVTIKWLEETSTTILARMLKETPL